MSYSRNRRRRRIQAGTWVPGEKSERFLERETGGYR